MSSHTSSTLRIGRVRLRYRVPSYYPKLERLRADLDDLATKRLASECGRVCASLSPKEDDSFWFIRRLEVPVRLQPGGAVEHHVQRCAVEIARALARSLSKGPGEDVLCFCNYAEYLAQFLADLAQGRAWGKWFYREFDGLRSLPTSSAITEGFLREPSAVEGALVRLHEVRQLDSVLRHLSEQQVERILAACLAASPESTDLACLRAVVDQLPFACWLPSGLDSLSARSALRLWLGVRSLHPHLPALGLCAAVMIVFDVLRLIPRLEEPARFEYHLARGEIGAASLLVPESSRSCLRAFEQESNLLLRLVQSAPPATAASPSAPSSEFTFTTPFGGAFLLLRIWQALGLEELARVATISAPQGWDRPATFRLVALLKCIGRTRMEEALSDRALRLAAGFEPNCALPELRRWFGIGGDPFSLFRSFLGVLRDADYLKGRILRLASVNRDDCMVLILQDLETGFWLYANAVPLDVSPPLAMLEEALAHIEGTTGEPTQYLVHELGSQSGGWQNLNRIGNATVLWTRRPALAGSYEIHNENPDWRLWSSGAAELAPEFRSIWTRSARRARFWQADLDYHDLGDGVHQSEQPLNLAWSVVASGILKSFARRLMGFDSSSADYLYANFLAGESNVTMASQRIEVRMPSVPLDVVLRVSGLHGQEFPQPSKPDRTIELRLPGLR